MTAVRVKICGLTRAEDAEAAVALGAAAVGFVFWPGSPRVVAAADVREIGRALPPLVTRVGVFVNQPPAEVAAIVRLARLDAVQLHGDEQVAEYEAIGVRILKSVTLDEEAARHAARRLPPDVTPLVDASDRERRGGTGRPADWRQAANLAAERPIVLAGGLTPANAAAAVRTVRPWAVDVSSGVESRPGVKDPQRLREFFAAVAAGEEA